MIDSIYNDEYYMREALKEAQKAFDSKEVPCGAIVVSNDTIIARGYNQVEILNDSTAHAEMIALTSAYNYLGAKYIPDCTMYVTLEPCTMCGGALYWSQLAKIVYGADDLKRGCMQLKSNILHPSTEVVRGILKNECEILLHDFFKKTRI